MKEFLLFTLLFIDICYRHVNAKNGVPFKPIMSVRLDRCTSHCNPKYCNISTICRPLNRTSKFVKTDIYLHAGVKFDAPIYVNIVTLKKFATVYRPHMVNLKFELCNELSFASHPLFFGLMKDKSVHSNLLEPCPISGHRGAKPRISNVFEYGSPLVPIVPAGEWRVDLTFSVERNGSTVVVVSWSDYYEIKSLTAEEF